MPHARLEAREIGGVGARDGGVVERCRRATRGCARRRATPPRRAPPTSGDRAPAPTRRRRRPRRRARARSASPTPGARVRSSCVPSIGSTIQRTSPPSSPSSSPSTVSPGRSAAMRSRSARSTARSASVTGVRSGFVSTSQVGGAEAGKRERVGELGELEREGEVGVGHAAEPIGPLRLPTILNFLFVTGASLRASASSRRAAPDPDQPICCTPVGRL